MVWSVFLCVFYMFFCHYYLFLTYLFDTFCPHKDRKDLWGAPLTFFLLFISLITGADIFTDPVRGGIQLSTLAAGLIWVFSDPAATARDHRGRKQEAERLPAKLHTQRSLCLLSDSRLFPPAAARSPCSCELCSDVLKRHCRENHLPSCFNVNGQFGSG